MVCLDLLAWWLETTTPIGRSWDQFAVGHACMGQVGVRGWGEMAGMHTSAQRRCKLSMGVEACVWTSPHAQHHGPPSWVTQSGIMIHGQVHAWGTRHPPPPSPPAHALDLSGQLTTQPGSDEHTSRFPLLACLHRSEPAHQVSWVYRGWGWGPTPGSLPANYVPQA